MNSSNFIEKALNGVHVFIHDLLCQRGIFINNSIYQLSVLGVDFR